MYALDELNIRTFDINKYLTFLKPLMNKIHFMHILLILIDIANSLVNYQLHIKTRLHYRKKFINSNHLFYILNNLDYSKNWSAVIGFQIFEFVYLQ